MYCQYKFVIEQVLDRGFPTGENRLVVLEHNGDYGYAVHDIIATNAKGFKRKVKKLVLTGGADMDSDDFEFLWKRAEREFREKYPHAV